MRQAKWWRRMVAWALVGVLVVWLVASPGWELNHCCGAIYFANSLEILTLEKLTA